MSKTINFSNIVNAFSRGNVPISRIYARGNNLIWSKTQSYEDMYLTIECTSDGDFKFDGTWMPGSGYTQYEIILYYSKNGGSWTEVSSIDPTTISCVTGDKVRFKGTNVAISPMVGSKQSNNTFRFGSGQFKAYGNIMSLLFGDSFRNATLTTGINDYAFKDLFNNTSNSYHGLTDVENLILPSTLTPHCFRAMFQNCQYITKAPELLATTLVDSCYRYMFNTCSRLSYVKCLATSGINTNNSTYRWLASVARPGTFIKDANTTWPTDSYNGIPSGWYYELPAVPTITTYVNTVTITSSGEVTIYYRKTGTSTWTEYTGSFNITATATYEAYATNTIGDSAVCTPVECVYLDYQHQYFTIEPTTSGTILWKIQGTDTKAARTIEYSDNGGSWTSITSTTSGVSISLTFGHTYRFRGTNTALAISNSQYSFFDITTNCHLYGNIMSLLAEDNFADAVLTYGTNDWAFCSLFKPTDTTTGSKILNASNLILPEGRAEHSFRAMFSNAKAMTAAPKEVKVQEGGIARYVCHYMFEKCTSLTTAPDLPCVTNGNNYLYTFMFTGCTALTSCKCLLRNPTFTSSGSCYRMFYNITTTGTLTKHPSATWTRGNNGVPNNWTIVDAT